MNQDVISFLFKAGLKIKQQDFKGLKHVPDSSDLIGQASRGSEEVLPRQNPQVQSKNAQKLNRKQKRAQDKHMKRGGKGKFRKY